MELQYSAQLREMEANLEVERVVRMQSEAKQGRDPKLMQYLTPTEEQALLQQKERQVCVPVLAHMGSSSVVSTSSRVLLS